MLDFKMTHRSLQGVVLFSVHTLFRICLPTCHACLTVGQGLRTRVETYGPPPLNRTLKSGWRREAERRHLKALGST